MRGRRLHTFLVTRTAQIMGAHFDAVLTEYLYRANGITTFFDVYARSGRGQLAIEVETTLRHAVENACKAQAVGVPLWVLVPRRRLAQVLADRLDPLALTPAGEPIKILLLGQLEKALTQYLSRRIVKRVNNKQTPDEAQDATHPEAKGSCELDGRM